jgi:hypothetical protein
LGRRGGSDDRSGRRVALCTEHDSGSFAKLAGTGTSFQRRRPQRARSSQGTTTRKACQHHAEHDPGVRDHEGVHRQRRRRQRRHHHDQLRACHGVGDALEQYDDHELAHRQDVLEDTYGTTKYATSAARTTASTSS